MSIERQDVKKDAGAGTGAATPPPRYPTPPRRGRWRRLVWGTPFAFAVVLWSFLLETDTARLMGAWADLALIAWTAIVVEGFVSALLDSFVEGGADPRVAAAAWTACSRCGARVPFDAGERQARCPFCDATVLPPTGRRAVLGPRLALFFAAAAAVVLGVADATHAPLMPTGRVALVLAAVCVAAAAWPFRRYVRNQPG